MTHRKMTIEIECGDEVQEILANSVKQLLNVNLRAETKNEASRILGRGLSRQQALESWLIRMGSSPASNLGVSQAGIYTDFT